jgi:alkanesulfonate monooxygenase SsuD/methylene tetrahydromethanopterin reductase-like flavin-dependent oxidoreductase (luciferase family)
VASSGAISIGWLVPPDVFELPHHHRQKLLDEAVAAGVGHLAVGDHVSFIVGAGWDGLVQASALLAHQPRLSVHVAAYLLPLRHPVPVARSISSIAQLAPGRLQLGIGVGGEDRHEVEICGVDPSTSGQRTDEMLQIIRGLLSGDSVSHAGAHFELENAVIFPSPDPAIPILVVGRSTAALDRAARFGDGWLGIWVSPEQFGHATSHIADGAEQVGRTEVPDRHELDVWCGFGSDAEDARRRLAPVMETLYATPFERFARYSPHGTPAEVAEALLGYTEQGCRSLNLIAPDPEP